MVTAKGQARARGVRVDWVAEKVTARGLMIALDMGMGALRVLANLISTVSDLVTGSATGAQMGGGMAPELVTAMWTFPEKNDGYECDVLCDGWGNGCEWIDERE